MARSAPVTLTLFRNRIFLRSFQPCRWNNTNSHKIVLTRYSNNPRSLFCTQLVYPVGFVIRTTCFDMNPLCYSYSVKDICIRITTIEQDIAFWLCNLSSGILFLHSIIYKFHYIFVCLQWDTSSESRKTTLQNVMVHFFLLKQENEMTFCSNSKAFHSRFSSWKIWLKYFTLIEISVRWWNPTN